MSRGLGDVYKRQILGALFEKWRKEKDLNINTLAKEAHICTTTYGKIKKGWM